VRAESREHRAHKEGEGCREAESREQNGERRREAERAEGREQRERHTKTERTK
jgi:hypothetical protein